MAVDNTSRWMPWAACSARADLPWITDTGLSTASDVRAMTQVCTGCPVRNHCAAYAVEAGITGGFWAGRDRDPLAAQPVDTIGQAEQPALPRLPRSAGGAA